MRSFRRPVRRARAPKVDVRWTSPSMINDQVLTLGTTLSAPLLNDADFNSLIVFERVRLERIKGWLCFSAVNSAVRGGAFCSIFKVPAGSTPDPTTGVTYDTCDLLWSGGAQWGTCSTTPGFANVSYQQIDVKTRRLMTSEDLITAQFRCTGAAGVTCAVTGMLRALWSYK